jgi:hypothetical protein
LHDTGAVQKMLAGNTRKVPIPDQNERELEEVRVGFPASEFPAYRRLAPSLHRNCSMRARCSNPQYRRRVWHASMIGREVERQRWGHLWP